MKRLAGWTEQRRKWAALYRELLREGPRLGLPQEIGGRRHVYHIYPVRSARRVAARAFLSENGVRTGIHYPTPVHLLPTWTHLGHKEGDFPQAESLAREEISLPIYPELTADRIERVAAAVNRFVEAH